MVKTKVSIRTLRFDISMTLLGMGERITFKTSMPIMTCEVDCGGNKNTRITFLN